MERRINMTRKILAILVAILMLVSASTSLFACVSSSSGGSNGGGNYGGSSNGGNYGGSSNGGSSSSSYNSDYNAIVDIIADYNMYTESCAKMHISMIENVIDVWGASKFGTVYNYVKKIKKMSDFDTYFSGESVETAKAAVCGAMLGDPTFYHNESRLQEAVDLCLIYNSAREKLDSLKSSASTKISNLRDDYGNSYSSEISSLNNWFIESKLFHEEMFNFNKSFYQFSSDFTEMKQNVSRYKMQADIH